jgi:hypothetical protein
MIGQPGTAWAHHSHAMFDVTHEETVTGTVKKFTFVNPHVFLFLVVSENGKRVQFPVEMSFTQNMERNGIGPNTFKPGDKVTVRLYPFRNGRPGGSYTGAIDARGVEHGSLAETHDEPDSARALSSR